MLLTTSATMLAKNVYAELRPGTSPKNVLRLAQLLVPVLAAVVLSYGLVADPHTVAADIRSLATALPTEAASIVGDQLKRVVSTSQDSKGFGLVLALLIALYGATKATAAMTQMP